MSCFFIEVFHHFQHYEQKDIMADSLHEGGKKNILQVSC